jgi:hypothetical protein
MRRLSDRVGLVGRMVDLLFHGLTSLDQLGLGLLSCDNASQLLLDAWPIPGGNFLRPPHRWTCTPTHLYRPLLCLCIKDKKTQPDEALPDDPTPSNRHHEVTRRPACALVLSRQHVAQSAVDLGEGTPQGAVRVGYRLPEEQHDVNPFWSYEDERHLVLSSQ